MIVMEIAKYTGKPRLLHTHAIFHIARLKNPLLPLLLPSRPSFKFTAHGNLRGLAPRSNIKFINVAVIPVFSGAPLVFAIELGGERTLIQLFVEAYAYS